MPNRFTVAQRRFIYKFIANRDGERCLICHKKPNSHLTLEIDHADNCSDNNSPENLHLLCGDCNKRCRSLSVEEHLALIKEGCALCVCESVCVSESVNGVSVIPKVMSYSEVVFRKWIIDMIKDMGFYPIEEAINAGAEVAECSIISTRRYMTKLTSIKGPLRITEQSGASIVRLKASPLETLDSHNNGNGHHRHNDADLSVTANLAAAKEHTRLKEREKR